MSVSVVSSISCDYASFSGNVSSVSTNKISVADMNDLSLLEDRLNQKIEALERQCTLLVATVQDMMYENRRLAARYDELLRDHAENVKATVTRIVGEK